MRTRRKLYGASLLAAMCLSLPVGGQIGPTRNLLVDWNKTIAVSRSTPTLQVVVNPQLLRGAAMHDGSFQALHELGADYVRYVPWFPYPRMVVAELEPPTDKTTFWDFSHIDPMLDDFMRATEGHSVILNFSTIPAWMFKTDKPVTYPDDPSQVIWNYTQGTELRDPSMKEVANYYVRLLSWYTNGGFKDELGKWHESGHHYKIAYWELLNEIEMEHHWTPQQYTVFYDRVSAAMHKVDPGLKFMGLALAYPAFNPDMFEYFLNPKNHHGGRPVDFISYHFYASPLPRETIDNWQYSFFDQEAGFLNVVRYVEEMRKRSSPSTKTDLDELGVILPTDSPTIVRGRDEMLEPKEYWNLAGALYADLYVQLAKMGIDVVGESQLVGYPSQFPSVSMMDYVNNKPNARFWVLKLLKDHFGPGDRLVYTVPPGAFVTDLQGSKTDLTVQGFETARGKCLLVINKRLKGTTLALPADFKASHIEYVAPATGDNAPVTAAVSNDTVELEPAEVAVITE